MSSLRLLSLGALGRPEAIGLTTKAVNVVTKAKEEKARHEKAEADQRNGGVGGKSQARPRVEDRIREADRLRQDTGEVRERDRSSRQGRELRQVGLFPDGESRTLRLAFFQELLEMTHDNAYALLVQMYSLRVRVFDAKCVAMVGDRYRGVRIEERNHAFEIKEIKIAPAAAKVCACCLLFTVNLVKSVGVGDVVIWETTSVASL